MPTIEQYYQKLYNIDGILTRIYDISSGAGLQLYFYPIDVYDQNGFLIHPAKTFDESHELTILLRNREAELNQMLDLSNQTVIRNGKKNKIDAV